MNIYLAGVIPWGAENYIPTPKEAANINILESFYYTDEYVVKMIPYLKNFMLDSGAFTFFSSGKSMDWDAYVEQYADFINKNKVRLFFELDIDKLIGYNEVIRLRRKLERLTNKQCIPVWHTFRGKENFKEMCEEYDYVSIGGIVSKEITKDQYKYFPWFINYAHSKGCKIHGLGFTNLQGLKKYHFDSVDSTAWVSGNRFGGLYHFNGKDLVKIARSENQRMKDTKKLAIVNFNEWVKYSIYARTHL